MPDTPVDLGMLDNLPEDQRAIVHEALKTTLASELANFAAGSTAAAGQCEHTRESGPLHGSQHTKCNNNFMDKVLHDRLQGMDDNAFQTFADRLNKVRSAINR